MPLGAGHGAVSPLASLRPESVLVAIMGQPDLPANVRQVAGASPRPRRPVGAPALLPPADTAVPAPAQVTLAPVRRAHGIDTGLRDRILPTPAREPVPMVPLLVTLALAASGLVAAYVLARRKNMTVWLGSYLRGAWRRPPVAGPTHVIFCFVDHFEPQWRRPDYATECRRVERWVEGYPRVCDGHRDADGRAPVHTFFYPEEEYRAEHLDQLAILCRAGLAEIEVHLHHDDDTSEGFRDKLRRFTRVLVERHDALPVDAASGQARWSFIHGNWALDNSRPDGRRCGVNDELIVLREEGCYADFTLPSAPDVTQTSTINSIYYASDDPQRPKSHDRGERVRAGGSASGDLMIIQGPLRLNWKSRKMGIMPRIENGDVKASNPPTPERIDLWVDTGIHVKGRPDWVFVKVHTHGTQDHDIDALLGEPVGAMFSHLEQHFNDGNRYKLHYVSSREMYNIVKAAEAGHAGDPNAFRDFQLPRPAYARVG